MTIDTRLAVYGTLAPGEPNHHQLAMLRGNWERGTVNGRLVKKGWGADLGYPAIELDPNAPAVPVQLFVSADLPEHWARLDAFEGDGYRREQVRVELDGGGAFDAWIYVNASD